MPVSRKMILLSAALAALFVSPCIAGESLPRPPEAYFGDYGYCALVLSTNRYDEIFFEAGPAQCQQPLSPCSTFKIPNALIGLQTGVVSGPEDLKKWDGEIHTREESNRDHSLRTAINKSIPWYFQELARDVGETRMADWLQKLDYGNQDISAGIDRFWLGGSLKIDAHGQMKLIRDLWRGALPFAPDYQAQVRDMLAQDSSLDGRLYGKTGSCIGAENQKPPDHGWFIGWVDWTNASPREPSTTFFVINITGASAWGREAKDIALQMLQDLQPGSNSAGTKE